MTDLLKWTCEDDGNLIEWEPELPPSGEYVRLDDLRPLIDAIKSGRFALHCAMLGYESQEDHEGIEITAEVLVELAKAVAPFAPDQVACKGCAPSHLLYGPAGKIAEEAAKRETAPQPQVSAERKAE